MKLFANKKKDNKFIKELLSLSIIALLYFLFIIIKMH